MWIPLLEGMHPLIYLKSKVPMVSITCCCYCPAWGWVLRCNSRHVWSSRRGGARLGPIFMDARFRLISCCPLGLYISWNSPKLIGTDCSLWCEAVRRVNFLIMQIPELPSFFWLWMTFQGVLSEVELFLLVESILFCTALSSHRLITFNSASTFFSNIYTEHCTHCITTYCLTLSFIFYFLAFPGSGKNWQPSYPNPPLHTSVATTDHHVHLRRYTTTKS